MKKNLLLLFFSFTLFFAAACGGKEQPETTPTPLPTSAPTSTPTPSPSPTPANAAKDAVDKLESFWNALMDKSYLGVVDASKGFGYDVSMDVSINRMLLSLLGLEDLGAIGLDMTMDMNNEQLSVDMNVNVNAESLLHIVMFSDFERLLYNLPEYSEAYGGSIAEGASGAMPNTEEMINLYIDTAASFFDAFRFEENYAENATLERDGYQVTGKKYTATLSISDINAILRNFSDTILSMYPDAETAIFEIPEDEMSLFYFNVYAGTDGTYAWELYPDTSADAPIGLICAENGFYFFITSEGETTVLLRSDKQSDTNGILYILTSGVETALNYTKTENGLSLTDAENTMMVDVTWQLNDSALGFDLYIATTDFGLTCHMLTDGKKSNLELSLSSYDTKLATITADYTIRGYNHVAMPDTFLDEEAWNAQLDSETLEADLNAFLETYPALRELLGLEENTDAGGEDPSIDDGTDNPVTADNMFSGLTGYYADENGEVYFEPLESEVLALGIPSTGLYYTEITPECRQELIQYVTSAFPSDYEQSGTFYYVLGNIYDDSVESQYFTEYYITDNINGYNVFDLYIEAITGHFAQVDIYCSSRTNAIATANDILTILGETELLSGELDEATMNEGFLIGNYLIYGVNYGEYYCISIY